jgi:hypothetical protein
MHLILLRLVVAVAFWSLLVTTLVDRLFAGQAVESAPQKSSGEIKQTLEQKQVRQEEDLDHLTAAGESDNESCEPCSSTPPSIQDKVSVPVPGSSGSMTAIMAQEEARAAMRVPVPLNQNQFINPFQVGR